jgi:hypothetical protein
MLLVLCPPLIVLCLTALSGAAAFTICVGDRGPQLAVATALCSADTPATFQNALSGSIPSDEILLMPGTFTGGVVESFSLDNDGNSVRHLTEFAARNIRLNMMGKDVTIASLAGPTKTIVSCEGVIDSFGFIVHSGESTDAVIEGLTIRGAPLALDVKVTKCPPPLNVLKDTYDHSCYWSHSYGYQHFMALTSTPRCVGVEWTPKRGSPATYKGGEHRKVEG